MASTLTGAALQASRAALSAALVDQVASTTLDDDDDSLEPGEIQEVDMQAQADGIRTVFSDPTNFNVKVGGSLFRFSSLPIHAFLAPPLLSLDSLVRLACH